LHRGTAGYFEGSYFTGMEGSLRTPCIARWPGKIAAGRKSNEIFHITDWFTTLLVMTGLHVPNDRVIDGKDQSAFLAGKQEKSNREGFIYWNGEKMYGVKWAELQAGAGCAKIPHRSRIAAKQSAYRQSGHRSQRTRAVQPRSISFVDHWRTSAVCLGVPDSVAREPLIPAGAPLDHVPNARASPVKKVA